MDSKTYVILGVLMLSLGTGGYVYFDGQKIEMTPELLKTTVICPSSMDAIVNPTKLTTNTATANNTRAYYINSFGVTKYKGCSVGWMWAEVYYAKNGLTIPDTVIIQEGTTLTSTCKKKPIPYNSAGIFCYYNEDDYIFASHAAIADCKKSNSELYCANLLFISRIPTTVSNPVTYSVDKGFIKTLETR